MKHFANTLTVEQQDEVADAFAIECRRVLPVGWRVVDSADNYAYFARVYQRAAVLGVITEVEWHDDGLWLHVSVSRNGGKELPTWKELCEVKDIFVGRERAAIQVLPKSAEHYSLSEVLHLFVALGRELPIPDLREAESKAL